MQGSPQKIINRSEEDGIVSKNPSKHIPLNPQPTPNKILPISNFKVTVPFSSIKLFEKSGFLLNSFIFTNRILLLNK
jgi:hypothetical protein